MKFSIAFIVVLTLWAALVVQVFKSNYESRQRQIEIVTAQAKAEDNRAELRQLKTQRLQSRKVASIKMHSKLSQFKGKLTDQFYAAAEDLSVVEPVEDCVVIRNVPTLDEPDCLKAVRRISIPESRQVAIRVAFFFRPASGPRYSNDELEEVEVSLDFDGEQPVEIPLNAGMNDVSISYRYGTREDHAVIDLSVNGEIKGLWKSYAEGGNGYGASSTTWSVQQAYKPGRPLPSLLRLNPGDTETEVRISLVEQGADSDG